MRSSLKPMCEFLKVFKKHIQSYFVNAMRETSFGPIFIALYNEEFGGDKGLKSNIILPKSNMIGTQDPFLLGANMLN